MMSLGRRFHGVSDAVFSLAPHWKDEFPARVRATRVDGESLWYLPADEVEARELRDANLVLSLEALCRDMYAVLARHARSGEPIREVTIACLEERIEQLGVETEE